MKAIRVLHVFMRMQCGGAENMIMNIYRNIDREKVQFDFLVHDPGKSFFDDEIKALGGRIFYVPRFRFINFFQYRKALLKFFSEHQREFVAVHGHLGSSACIYLYAAKKYGIYAIAHSHNTYMSGLHPKQMMHHSLNRLTRLIADEFFACSYEAGMNRFGKKVVKGNNFRVIKNAIETERYTENEGRKQEITYELGVSDKLVVGHIGRFSKQKNHKFLIQVFKEILNIRPESILMLVGDGELRGEIENTIKKLGIADNVIMTGVRSDVNELLLIMDCFVFPSLYEGLGIVAIEAEYMGIPCFISDKCSKELFINNNVYSISLKKSPKEWAEIIVKNVDNRINAEVAKNNVKNAGYDIKETAKMLESLYIYYSKQEEKK